MSAERALLVARDHGADPDRIRIGREVDVVPDAPSHVSVMFPSAGGSDGSVVVGGMDRGAFTAYARFDDAETAGRAVAADLESAEAASGGSSAAPHRVSAGGPAPAGCGVVRLPAWFGQPGGGWALRLDRPIAYYLDHGLLRGFTLPADASSPGPLMADEETPARAGTTPEWWCRGAA